MEGQGNRQQLALFAAAASAPIAAGALLPLSLTDPGGAIVCPFRATTGIPCPLCGATRAFVAFGHGDGSWIRFNGYWVLLSLAVIAVALALLVVRSLAGKRQPGWAVGDGPVRPALMLGLLAAVALPGWIWALLNKTTIG